LGDPIVEADGLYRLANGQLVLGGRVVEAAVLQNSLCSRVTVGLVILNICLNTLKQKMLIIRKAMYISKINLMQEPGREGVLSL